jgi:hypothetical protein
MTAKTRQFFLLSFVLFLFFINPGNYFSLAVDSEIEKTEVPNILPRSSWENTTQLKGLLKIESLNKRLQEFEDLVSNRPLISRIIVYNSDCQTKTAEEKADPTCNFYGQNPISIIQNIYRYSVINKKSDDIDYNFIISEDGKIFEGRYGGNASFGSRSEIKDDCFNQNVGSIAVLLLTNTKNGELPLGMSKSLVKLIAWLSATNNLNVTGRTDGTWQYFSVED